MQRRDEQTKTPCKNPAGVTKNLTPSVVDHEAKKANGYRPIKHIAKSIPNVKQVEETIEEKVPEIANETVQVKGKPGRKKKI